jgi:large subunit ribosomal protein L25
MLTIKAEIRGGNENSAGLRETGFIPAVFYGPKQESTSIKIKEGDFIKTYGEAGESSVIILDDGKEQHEALIHDVQFDAVSSKATHVDFYVIEKGKKVEVAVPIEFIGQAPAEKTLGGVLVKVIYEVEIKAMPKDLPHSIEVDVSSLVDFDSQIHASDIKLPAGVELITDAEEVIALVQAHKEEVIEDLAPAVDLSSIEVEKKGKEETEGGEEAK